MKLIELTHSENCDPFLLTELTRNYPFSWKDTDLAQSFIQQVGGNTYIPGEKLRTIIPTFKKLGWQYTDSGSFSSVFVNPKKLYILKINYRADRPFAWFALLTRKFPNPHFPRIGDMKIFNFQHQRYYMFMIEKLEDGNIPPEWKYFRDVGTWKHTSVLKKNLLLLPKRTQQYFQENPSLVDALEIISTYRHGYKLDIFPSNIMFRKDGTLVIVDPYYQ
ncbi:Uncharacterised protein [uncultured archaeon]|nr:Uncharacterised protein [uncultured archaeon]